MPPYKHNDVDDLLTNPVWEDIKEELEARQEVLLSELLKLKEPAAIEYKLITQLLSMPRDKREELKEEKK